MSLPDIHCLSGYIKQIKKVLYKSIWLFCFLLSKPKIPLYFDSYISHLANTFFFYIELKKLIITLTWISEIFPLFVNCVYIALCTFVVTMFIRLLKRSIIQPQAGINTMRPYDFNSKNKINELAWVNNLFQMNFLNVQ